MDLTKTGYRYWELPGMGTARCEGKWSWDTKNLLLKDEGNIHGIGATGLMWRRTGMCHVRKLRYSLAWN